MPSSALHPGGSKEASPNVDLLMVTKLKNKVELKRSTKILVARSTTNIEKERPELKTLNQRIIEKKFDKPIVANSLHSIKLKALNVERNLYNFPADDIRIPLTRDEQAKSLLRTSQMLHKYKYGVTSETKTKLLLNRLLNRPDIPHETYSTELIAPTVRCRTADATTRDNKSLAVQAMSPEDTKNKQFMLRFTEGLVPNDEPVEAIRQKTPLYTTATFRSKKTYRFPDELPKSPLARKFSLTGGEDFGFDDSRKEHFFQEGLATLTAPIPIRRSRSFESGVIDTDSIDSDSIIADDDRSLEEELDPIGATIPSQNAHSEQVAMRPANMLQPKRRNSTGSHNYHEDFIEGMVDTEMEDAVIESSGVGDPLSLGRMEATITMKRTAKQKPHFSPERGARRAGSASSTRKPCFRGEKCDTSKDLTTELMINGGMIRMVPEEEIHTSDTVTSLMLMLDKKGTVYESLSRPVSGNRSSKRAETPPFIGESMGGHMNTARSPMQSTKKLKSMLIKCAKCFKNKAALWCPQCKCAYCGICWIGVAHHALPQMAVPGDTFDRSDYKTARPTPTYMNPWSSNFVSKYSGVQDRTQMPADKPKDPSDRLQTVVHDYPLNPVFLDGKGRVYHFQEITQVRPNTAMSVATTNISLRNSRAAVTNHQLISIDPHLAEATATKPSSPNWDDGRLTPADGPPLSPFGEAMTQRKLDMLATQYIDGIHKTRTRDRVDVMKVDMVSSGHLSSVGGNSDSSDFSGFTNSSPSRLAKKITITPTAPAPLLNKKRHNITIPSSRAPSPALREIVLPTHGNTDLTFLQDGSSTGRSQILSRPSARGGSASGNGNPIGDERDRDPYLDPVPNPFRSRTPTFKEREGSVPSSPAKVAREFTLINRTPIYMHPMIPNTIKSRDLATLTVTTNNASIT